MHCDNPFCLADKLQVDAFIDAFENQHNIGHLGQLFERFFARRFFRWKSLSSFFANQRRSPSPKEGLASLPSPAALSGSVVLLAIRRDLEQYESEFSGSTSSIIFAHGCTGVNQRSRTRVN